MNAYFQMSLHKQKNIRHWHKEDTQKECQKIRLRAVVILFHRPNEDSSHMF